MTQHYKDIDGKIYGYKATETCTPISIEEVIELTKPSEEELLKQSLTAQINEAKSELASLDWINSKYVREVQVLKTITDEEYHLKYQVEYTRMVELVLLINELETKGAI